MWVGPTPASPPLLNAPAGYERAIVTDIPGTTRDTVEESVLCGGVRLRLIDTAGIRDTEDTVEKLGVERSRQALERADLALAVVDGSAAPTEEDAEILRLASRCPRWILVLNKQDLHPGHGAIFSLAPSLPKPDAAVEISAPQRGRFLSGTGGGASVSGGDIPDGSILTNARQQEAASRARGGHPPGTGGPGERSDSGCSPHRRRGGPRTPLGELTGRTAREEIVQQIFSRFCVGKMSS